MLLPIVGYAAADGVLREVYERMRQRPRSGRASPQGDKVRHATNRVACWAGEMVRDKEAAAQCLRKGHSQGHSVSAPDHKRTVD